MPFKVFIDGGLPVGEFDDRRANTDQLNDWGLSRGQRWMYVGYGRPNDNRLDDLKFGPTKVVVYSMRRLTERELLHFGFYNMCEYQLSMAEGLIDTHRGHWVERNRMEWPGEFYT